MENNDNTIDWDKIEAGEESFFNPIAMGGGLIAYRKYLWALKFLKEKQEKLKEYKAQVIADIDHAIESKEKQIERLENEVERAMLADPAVDTTPTGGKSISLPDVASVSISKLQNKVVIVDAEVVLKEMGEQEFGSVKVSLDVKKAKDHILETGQVPTGATMKKSRTLTVRFKK